MAKAAGRNDEPAIGIEPGKHQLGRAFFAARAQRCVPRERRAMPDGAYCAEDAVQPAERQG